MQDIYFDYNATTPTHEAARLAVIDFMNKPHNASALHSQGQKARKILEETREIVKQAINAPQNNQVVFTASGTEANNLILRSQQQCVISSIEHKSVLNVAPNPIIISVNEQGIINLYDLEEKLKTLQPIKDKPVLVSVMLANNETGVIQPIKSIVQIARKYNCITHTDAIQAFGKMPLDMTDLGVDSITISGHKFGAPLGAASLIYRDNIRIKPIIFGGGQERGLRSGTENIPAIAGMCKAIEQIPSTIESMRKTEKMRNKIEEEIKKIAPNARVFGQNAPRLPNTSYIATPNLLGTTQMISLSVRKIFVSSRAACSSAQESCSHVLSAMNVPDNISQCAIRISLGWDSTKESINHFLDIWKNLFNKANELSHDVQSIQLTRESRYKNE